MNYTIEPIGVMHSCYQDLFGIPRQPGLVKAARGWIEFYSPYDREEAFVGLEDFSHLWITFLFHLSLDNKPSLMVRPPRTQGGQKLGVFATRAPSRPNQLGQSVAELEKIERARGKVKLYLKGVDLVEGTPIIDVKPYLPYVDAVQGARGGFAHKAPDRLMRVEFTAAAAQQLAELEADRPDLRQLIIEVLQHDPRPKYYRGEQHKQRFGVRLYDLDVRWQLEGDDLSTVVELVRLL